MKTRILQILATALLACALEPALGQPAYTIEALELLPATDEAQVNGMNAAGTVVGGTKPTGSIYAAARWAAASTSATELASVVGQNPSVATAVNASGQLALQAIAPPESLYSAHFWNGTTLTNIGSIGSAKPSGGPVSFASSMNAAGQVVGWSWSPALNYHGFSWQSGVLTELAGPAGCTTWRAYGINTSGQIVGYAANGACGFDSTGVVWANASAPAVLLNDVLAGAGLPARPVGIRFAFSINDGGTVFVQETVSGKPRCLLITPAPVTVIELGTLGPNQPNAGCVPGTVNNVGEAVASQSDGVDDLAMLWSGNTLYDLETLLDAPAQAAWNLKTAVAINDSGTITGLGTFNGQLVGYRATRTAGPGGSITVSDSVATIDDRQLAFGTITIGVGIIGTVTVSNGTASTASISITEGLAAPFGIADPGDCSIDLAPAASCTITLTYDPVAPVASSDSLTLNLGGTPAVVNVSGTGRTATTTLSDSIAPADDSTLPFAGSVLVGGTGTATATVQNTDLVPVSVALTDGLAAPFSFQNAAACDLTLNAGQSCTLTVVFAPTAAGAINDSFTLNAGGTVYTVAVTGAPGVPNADLRITKTATPAVVQPGVSGSDLTTFTLTATNTGPDSAGVIVTDLLPAGLNFVSAAPGQGTYDAGTGIWNIGTLANGAQTTLQINVQAAPSTNGCVSNTATVATVAPAVDSGTGSNADSTVIAAPACANVRIGLQALDDAVATVLLDDDITITHDVEVRNEGPSAASNVVLTVNAYSAGDGATTFDLGTLQAGESRTVRIRDYYVYVNGEDIDVTYALSVASSTTDPVMGDNSYNGGYVIERTGSSSSHGCFIATAAYGSYLEPEVMVLRMFRDRVLLTNTWGRAFVAWYYRVSPPLADLVRGSEALRIGVRGLLTPVVYAIKFPAAAGGILLLLCLGPWILRRRRLYLRM